MERRAFLAPPWPPPLHLRFWWWFTSTITLRTPPFRFYRSIPLPRFRIGYKSTPQPRLCCGWWGIRLD